MGSLSEFHTTLSSLADELGIQEIHLAALGLHIRRKLPGFAPEDYGFGSFTDLMGSCTEIGELRFGANPEDRWFMFRTIVQPTGTNLDQHEIVKSVWSACVDIDESHRAWLDLEDCRHLETDADTVANELERYLELPRFGRARQAALLRDFSQSSDAHAYRELLVIANTWGAEKSPYGRLLQQLEALGLRQAWFVCLRQAVETELRVWASEHGVPPANLFLTPNRRSTWRSTSQGSRASEFRTFEMDERQLRTFLRAAMDEMTLAELGQWSVPARLLLTKRR
jgi:hypothetical protein